jgi:hypothetical protein
VKNWTLQLRPEPGHAAPPDVRLRRALKVLLRGFGLRVVEIREVEAGDEAKEHEHKNNPEPR